MPPAKVLCLSLCERGGDCEGGVVISPESPLRLDVSLLMPGKLPEDGAWPPPLGTRAAALGFPDMLEGAKKVCEWRGVPSGGDTGPSGPLYIWPTKLAAPVYWSLCGLVRRVLVDLVKLPMGMLGALSGSAWLGFDGAMIDRGRGLGLLGPTAMDLARCNNVGPFLSAGAGGNSLLVSGMAFIMSPD